jgi:hypothetical protein
MYKNVRFMRNLDKAVSFLLEHARDPNDDLRQARDKHRKRILYAISTGDLEPDSLLCDTVDWVPPPPRFVAWARTKWPTEMQAFLARYDNVNRSALGLQDILIGDIIPGELEKCQDYLMQAYSGIRAMASELHNALKEIERLEPIEAKYEAICEKNRQNAARPRKE